MKLPFNTAQFLKVFKDYNTTVFPAQIIFIALAVLLIIFAIKKYNYYSAIMVGDWFYGGNIPGDL